ncbi:MAG: radical SAM/SPASM domain-containing protein, partial [Alphaproteobacteria bacterium]
MESIYYVISWLCHRRCAHCYDDRFRPYVRDELARVVGEAESSWVRIADNLPDTMMYRDMAAPLPDGGFEQKVGRIILFDPIREPVLYPLLRRLRDRYAAAGGVRLVVQTTGDLVTDEILDALLDAGVWQISITGMDDFHVGMEGDRKQPVIERLTAMFEARGMAPTGRRFKGKTST